jgi:hypothetical protein
MYASNRFNDAAAARLGNRAKATPTQPSKIVKLTGSSRYDNLSQSLERNGNAAVQQTVMMKKLASPRNVPRLIDAPVRPALKPLPPAKYAASLPVAQKLPTEVKVTIENKTQSSARSNVHQRLSKPVVAESEGNGSIEIVEIDAEESPSRPAVKRIRAPQQPAIKEPVKPLPVREAMPRRSMQNNNDHSSGSGSQQMRKRKSDTTGSSYPKPSYMNPTYGQQAAYGQQGQGADGEEKTRAVLPGGRRRLFVGGLARDVTEDDVKTLFKEFGEIEEIWINTDRGFGFLKMDTKANAEKAKMKLDATDFKGRSLTVRLASQSCCLKVCNISKAVTNELLQDAFERFGELERVCVACDAHSKPLGYAYVEFKNKRRAEVAMRQINENCFLLTKSLRPISVKAVDEADEEDGLKETNIKRNHDIMMERSEPPRFLDPTSFEYDIALKWKTQYDFEGTQRQYLEQQLDESRERLQLEIDDMYKDQKAWALRAELAQRQEELERLERFRSVEDPQKTQKRARIEEAALLRNEQFRRQEEAFLAQQDELRRRAEVRQGQLMMVQAQSQSQSRYAGGNSEYIQQNTVQQPVYEQQYEQQQPVEVAYGQNAVIQQAQAYYKRQTAARLDEGQDFEHGSGVDGGASASHIMRARLEGGIDSASLRSRRF